MIKTYSTITTLGTPAPAFRLLDVISGKNMDLEHTHGKATVIVFICNHCPYVKHIIPQLVILATEYIKKGVIFFAINSNDKIAYPEDSPENMLKIAKTQHYPFPYLYDETQDVAKSYKAVCTPDFFIFDAKRILQYRGQFDDSRPESNIAVTGNCLRVVLDSLLSNQPISIEQKPSIGCSIKWKENIQNAPL